MVSTHVANIAIPLQRNIEAKNRHGNENQHESCKEFLEGRTGFQRIERHETPPLVWPGGRHNTDQACGRPELGHGVYSPRLAITRPPCL